MLLPNSVISFDSYTSNNKFYNFIIFSLLINAGILLVNCLLLIFHLDIHFSVLKFIFFS